MSKRETMLTWGDVSLGAPLVGATITIHDLAGRCLHEARRATHDTGSFALQVPAPLAQQHGLRLVATGGRLRGRPFHGCVVRQIDRLRPGTYHRLHGLTTLLAAVRARRPQLSSAGVASLVRRALEWPSDVDLTQAIALPQCHESLFDPGEWLAQARQSRRYGDFLESIVADVIAGRAHPMRQTLPLLRDWGGLAEWAFNGLAGGMLSWGGGQAISWFVSLMGYQSSEQKQLDAIQQKLDQMGRQLDDTQRTVHELERLSTQTLAQVTALASRLETVARELKTDIAWQGDITALNATLATSAAVLRQAAGDITATFDDLQCFWRIDPHRIDDDVKRAARRRVDTLLAPGSGVLGALQHIHDTLLGNLGTGYLADLATLAARCAADEAQLALFARALEQRLEFLLGVQLIGVSLVFDAYLADTPNDAAPALAFRTKALERLRQQLDAHARCLEMMTASRIDGPSAGEFNAGHSAGSLPLWLASADRLASKVRAALRVASDLAPADPACTITVRLLNHPAATRHTLKSGLQLALRSDTAPAPIAPIRSERHDGVTAKDRQGVALPYQMLVLDFAVPPGRYRLAPGQTPGDTHAAMLRALDETLIVTVDALAPAASLALTAWVHAVAPRPVRAFALPPATGVHQAVADALAVESGQRLHALDWHNARIVSFDLDGAAVRTWGEHGSGATQFGDIHGIAASPDGSLWISDAQGRRVLRCDGAAGRVLGALDTRMQPLVSPTALATTPQGWLALADGGHGLRLVSPEGRRIAEWEAPGADAHGFGVISGLDADADGALYVADAQQQRVRVLALAEQPRHMALMPRASWGRAGSGRDEFDRPVALAVDRPARRLIVADERNHRLQVFALDGQWLASWGDRQVCAKPGSLAVDPTSGAVFVAHGGGRLITMLRAVRVSLAW